MTRNPNDDLNQTPLAKDLLAEIEAAIERSVLARAMPGWGEEVWENGRISNGECP